MQISRFLVVDPQQRYTAHEALAHPFFQQYDVEEVRHFSPFRKFKVRLGMGVSPHPGSCRSRAVGWVSQLNWEKLGVQTTQAGGPGLWLDAAVWVEALLPALFNLLSGVSRELFYRRELNEKRGKPASPPNH